MAKLWKSYRNVSLIWKIGVAFLFGIAAGFTFGPSINVVQPFGDLFLRLLKFLIIPMLLFTIITGLNQTTPKQLGRMGGKVLGFYIVTSALALTIGLMIASWVNPGIGLSIPGGASVEVPDTPSFVDILLGIVPTNMATAFTELNLLQIIFIAIAFGLAIGSMRDSKKPQIRGYGKKLHTAFEAGSEATFRIMDWVLEYAPIGVFALIATTIGTQGRILLVDCFCL
nr:cation:dicarboxylase symporter family transporter [Halobacillus amylolyticus]